MPRSRRLAAASLLAALAAISWGCHAVAPASAAPGERSATAAAGGRATAQAITGGAADGAQHGSLLRTLAASDRGVWAVAFQPGGRHLAAGTSSGSVRLWDADRGDLVATLEGPTDRILDLAFSPDGKHLAAASKDRSATVWSLARREIAARLVCGSRVSGVEFHPGGELLATCEEGGGGGIREGSVRIWEWARGEERARLVPTAGAAAVRFDPTGERIAGALVMTEPSFVAEGASWSDVRAVGYRGMWATDVAFSPDGRELALSYVRSPLESRTVGVIQVFDAHTLESVRVVRPPSGPVAIAYSPDGATIAAALPDDRAVALFDAKSGDLVQTLVGGSPGAIAFRADGRRLAAACPTQGCVELWRLDSATVELGEARDMRPPGASARPLR